MSNVYVFVHPAYTDQICYPQTLNVWETFARRGAHVKYGAEIRKIRPLPGDQLVGYGRMDEFRDVSDQFPRVDKWHYVVDESSSTSKPYDKAISYMELLNFGNIIVTYQNPGHLARLSSSGYRYAIMPQTFPAIREKKEKEHGILLSGQVSDAFYPVRSRTWRLLESSLPEHVKLLRTPGQDISTRTHNVIREEYYNLVDKCRMGIVCRAGHRDRFVAKYIEMGACHCLPVGDCPTYMPTEMKQAMVDVGQMRDADVLSEMRRLLTTGLTELTERTVAYTAGVERHYLADPNMDRLLKEITVHRR